jgi:hypothetical protein
MVRVLVSAETMERLMAHHGGASSEEIIAEVLLAGAETGAEPGDGDEVREYDRKIEVSHE